MSHYYALLSIIYMMGFVALFDRVHVDRFIGRFCKSGLMSREDVERIREIMLACQE
ncbi:MAG TPA: hypothetical protein VML19_16835 [Verrucomicrobiae bacterium]|nr:hypothetical protein [Verrucomicrobiae bacterium]